MLTTTANLCETQLLGNLDLYVGTHIGSFKSERSDVNFAHRFLNFDTLSQQLRSPTMALVIHIRRSICTVQRM